KEAQRCHCESSICRGWIGEDPEKEKRDRKERKERELKKKREERRRDVKEFLEDMDLEEEIEKLCISGLKNRAHTLTLCRLMVRAEDLQSRAQLLKLLQGGEPACRRLFLDYHGLRLIWSWMMDVGANKSNDGFNLRMEILQTLSKLPIPNKTVLQDSKVMSVVEKWSILPPNAPVPDNFLADGSSDGTEPSNTPRLEVGRKERKRLEWTFSNVSCVFTAQTLELIPVYPSIMEVPDEETLRVRIRQVRGDDEGKEETDVKDRNSCGFGSHPFLRDLDVSERSFSAFLKISVEYEIEAIKKYLDKENRHEKQSYDRHWRQDRFRNRIRKGSRFEERNVVPIPRMSKQERRQLFAMKVAQEEEEVRQRRHQQEVWRQHEDRCLALGVDPHMSTMFDPQTGYPCYYDPATNSLQAYPPQDPNSIPPGGMPPEMGPGPMFNPNNPMSPHLPGMPPHGGVPPHMIPGGMPPGGFDPNNPHVPHQPMPFDPGNHQNSFLYQVDHSLHQCINNINICIPIDAQPVPQPHYHHVHPTSLPIQQPFVPAPPPPLPPPVRLPPKWKSAKDSEGRTYYYHVKTRVSQWEPPQWTETDQQPESESSSDSSDDDDDDEDEDDSSSTDEEEEAEQEEKFIKSTPDGNIIDGDTNENPKQDMRSSTAYLSGMCLVEEEEMELVQDQTDSFLLQQEESRKREKRREGLVQERIISPRREEDRQDLKKYREIKEKLRRKKEQARSRERSERSKKRHRDSKQRSSSKSSEKPVTVAADTSSDAARKIKDQFRLHMSVVIVQYLNPYRKPDCKTGRITNTEDFKHLARKLTHFVMLKELKHCRSVDDLECNDNVKHKARDFIKKYMAKFGAVYQRPKDDD
ncbi:hypothetical protein L9F63_013482, partial [Diploptera punctata]